MNFFNYSRRILSMFLLCILVIFLLFSYAVSSTSKAPYIEKGWEYTWDDTDITISSSNVAWHPMNFPGQPPGRDGRNVLWLRIKLPEEKITYPTIYAKYIRQNFEAYLDNNLIYKYGDFAISSKQQFTPFFPWHLIVLNEDAPGKTLYFRIHSTGPSIGIMAMVQYASLLEVLSDKAVLDLFKIVSATLTLSLGLFVLALYLRDRKNYMYLTFSGSALLGSTMVFGSTFTCMLLWNNPAFWTNMTFTAAAYWPALLLAFLGNLVDDQYKSAIQRLTTIVFIFESASLGAFLFDPTLIYVIYLVSILIHLTTYLIILYVFRAKLRYSQEAQLYALGSTFWNATLLHDALGAINLTHPRTPFGAFGQFAEILALTSILILRYLAVQDQLKAYSCELEQKNSDLNQMHVTLQTLNQNLDHIVDTRTMGLTVQKACLQQLFEKSPDAMAMLDMDYRVININPAFELLWGVSKQEALGKKIDGILPILGKQEESEYIRNTIASGNTVHLDTIRHQANGEAIHASLIAYPFITEINTEGIYIIYRDISAKKHAEQLLKDSERQYRLIAENTSDVIWLMDLNMNLIYISPSIEKLLGFTPEEMMRQPISEVFLSLSPTTINQLIEAYSFNNKTDHLPIRIELEQTRKNQKIIWTESLISIAENDDGEILGFLGVTRDINERKLTQNLLLHSYERRKTDEFFNNILRDSAISESEIYLQGLKVPIQLPQQFSLFFLSINKPTINPSSSNTDFSQLKMLVDTIINILNQQPSTIAWESSEGIGILWFATILTERKTEEYEAAKNYLQQLSGLLPSDSCNIGIADYFSGFSNFSIRFKHAQTAVKIGNLVWPDQSVSHFEDCGVYQVLAHYADTNEAAAYVDRTLGPLLDYDQSKGTDLLITLEKILLAHSLKEAADQMFFHHKTILFRKQRIETILNVSLDSFQTRMALGAAIHILKLLRAQQETYGNEDSITSNSTNTTDI